MKKSESESGVLSSACVFLQQRGTHALTPLNKTEKLTSNKNLQDKNDFQILILSRLFAYILYKKYFLLQNYLILLTLIFSSEVSVTLFF